MLKEKKILYNACDNADWKKNLKLGNLFKKFFADLQLWFDLNDCPFFVTERDFVLFAAF